MNSKKLIVCLVAILFISTSVMEAQEQTQEQITVEKKDKQDKKTIKKQKAKKRTVKKVKGKINGIGAGFLSIIYREEVSENPEEGQPSKIYMMNFSVDETTNGINTDLTKLKRGDVVKIRYVEETETKGEETKIVKRLAKTIQFIKTASEERSPGVDRQELFSEPTNL